MTMTVVAQTGRQRFWLRVRRSRSTHPAGVGYPWHIVIRSLTMTTQSSESQPGPVSRPRALISISSGAHSCGTTRTSPPTDPTSYRLPVGDIINGELTLIYHAIYAAAALLSGAHGGLPGIDENDRGELRNIISEIYPEMAREFKVGTERASAAA